MDYNGDDFLSDEEVLDLDENVKLKNMTTI